MCKGQPKAHTLYINLYLESRPILASIDVVLEEPVEQLWELHELFVAVPPVATQHYLNEHDGQINAEEDDRIHFVSKGHSEAAHDGNSDSDPSQRGHCTRDDVEGRI